MVRYLSSFEAGYTHGIEQGGWGQKPERRKPVQTILDASRWTAKILPHGHALACMQPSIARFHVLFQQVSLGRIAKSPDTALGILTYWTAQTG